LRCSSRLPRGERAFDFGTDKAAPINTTISLELFAFDFGFSLDQRRPLAEQLSTELRSGHTRSHYLLESRLTCACAPRRCTLDAVPNPVKIVMR